MKPVGREGNERERGRRGSAGKEACLNRLSGPNAAVEYVRSLEAVLDGSVLALFLDKEFNLLAMDNLGQGRAADCHIKPYLLVRRGLELSAAGFLLVQSSPDRISRATVQEIALTKEIRRAGEDFDVHLLNHLIVTRKRVIEVP